jgi:acyl dehydratase
MADADYIGKEYPSFSVDVEKGRIKMFAASIGEENPIYFDEETAKNSGYLGIPVPPTFAFTLTMEAGQSFNILEDMGIPKTQAMHGEQGFTYYDHVYAGDTVTGSQRITDIYEKKGGALQFIEAVIELRNQNEVHVADLRSVIVVRHNVGEKS